MLIDNSEYMNILTSMYEFIRRAQYGAVAGVNYALMDKTEGKDQYVWYLQKAVENGWSRNVLAMQIDSGLYQRQQGEKIQNFEKLLPDTQSELAIQTMKDPYIFDFVNMREKMVETDIEHELVSNV